MVGQRVIGISTVSSTKGGIMRSSLIMVLCLLFFSTAAFSQAGHIGIYTDEFSFECDLYDLPGLVEVYVVHLNTPGATYSRFELQTGGGFSGIYIGETIFDPRICDPIPCEWSWYGGCVASPILVKIVSYFMQGTSPPCAWLKVVPFSGYDTIDVIDCGSNTLAATGGVMYFNPDGSCDCTVPSEGMNWGQIRSLYR